MNTIVPRMMAAAVALFLALTVATGASDLPPQQTNHIVPRLMEILKRWETCQTKAYLDSDSTWHVGYGTGNSNKNLPFVIDQNTVLKDCDEAMTLLVADLNGTYAPQLTTLLAKYNIKVNDYQFSALLDAGYNRGMGRLRDSKAFDWLKRPSEKWYKEHAAEALVFSHVDGFTPLDVNAKGETRLGLTLRRIDDASLFLTKP